MRRPSIRSHSGAGCQPLRSVFNAALPLEFELHGSKCETLIKTSGFEWIRRVVPDGRRFGRTQHRAKGSQSDLSTWKEAQSIVQNRFAFSLHVAVSRFVSIGSVQPVSRRLEVFFSGT